MNIFNGTPCMPWPGRINRKGYGVVMIDCIGVEAHRAVYISVRGEPASGKVLDHLCRVRHCVNPDHLEVVTRGENTLRGESPHAKNKRKTHCPAGHPYSRENTYYPPGTRYRACKSCRRITALAAYHARKAVAQ